MSSREFSEWLAYAAIEPFGEERADLRAAIIACTIANAFRGKKRRAFKLADFMPQFDQPEPQQDWQTQLQIIEMLNEAFGGKDLRVKRDT